MVKVIYTLVSISEQFSSLSSRGENETAQKKVFLETGHWVMTVCGGTDPLLGHLSPETSCHFDPRPTQHQTAILYSGTAT